MLSKNGGMRILIADDHAVFRHGLKDILARHFAGVSFGEVDTAQSALEAVWNQPWDIVVLDVSMPGRSGVEILHDIHQARPKLPVLVLSMHPEEQYALRVLEAGASGYITKIKAAQDLVDAVEKVLAGGKYISSKVADELVNQLRPGARKTPHEKLSNREFQIMRLTAQGKATKDIALELSISLQTVSTHRARILKKLGLQSTAELIRYAVQNDLID